MTESIHLALVMNSCCVAQPIKSVDAPWCFEEFSSQTAWSWAGIHTHNAPYLFLSCVKMILKPHWKSPQGTDLVFIYKGAISHAERSD